jgi:23S rRNA pseudouridine1911/1915/1917 synthase
VKPNPTPVRIGFEDEHLLVAWKPHGILTSGNSGSTFVRTLNRTRSDLSEGGVLPCHRLDFGTSGWVVFGKTKQAARAVGLLFEQRRVAKRYVALVLGKVPRSMALMWSLDGKTACTRVERLAMGTMAGAGSVSLVRAEPVTGRTHQIRRQLFGAGHGIVGDDRYYVPGERYTGSGLFLCAYGLAFEHPLNAHVQIQLEAEPSKKFRKVPFVHQSEFVQRFRLSSHE